MEHFFNTEIAKKYGLSEAVVFEQIAYWVDYNKKSEKNFYDGHYWTYNSVTSFSKIFYYFSAKQIRNIIKKLEDNGLILAGNYNKDARDRTKWYTLTELGEEIFYSDYFAQTSNSMCPNGQSSVPKRANHYHYNTIIDNNNINICSSEMNECEDSSKDDTLDKLEKDFEMIYSLYPKKVGKVKAFARYKQWIQKSGRKVNGKTYHLTNKQIWYAVKKYVDQLESKDTDLQYYKGFDVLLGDALLDYVDFDN